MAYGKMVKYNPNQVATRPNNKKRRRNSSYGNGFQNLVRAVPYAGDAAVAGYNYFKTNAVAASAGQRATNPVLGYRRGGYKQASTIQTGKYAGGFGKLKKYRGGQNDTALKSGHGKITECRGAVAGPHAVYVGFSTFDLINVAEVVAVSVLRRLFKKCGYDISDPTVNLSLSNLNDNDSSQWVLNCTYCDSQGNEAAVTYNLIAGETLVTLSANSQMQTLIKQYATGDNSSILRNVSLCRVQPEGFVMNVGSLEMANMKMNIKMSNTINIQNRTKSVSGSDDVDRVDTQPLVGRSYHFKRSTPFVNHHGTIAPAPNMTSLFERWESTKGGVHLISDASPGFDNNLRKLPMSSYFKNCSKSGSANLEPGSIKQHTISNTYSAYYETFIKKLAWFNGNTDKKAQKIGDCVLFGFEERLDSGVAVNITAQYQTEMRVFGYISAGRATRSKPVFNELTFSV